MPRGTVEFGVGETLEVLDEFDILCVWALKLPPARLGELNCNDLALVMTGTCCLGEGDCLTPRAGDEPDSGVRISG